MNIKQIMTSNPTTCRTDTNLAAVTQKMWDHDCGFVPVVDDAGQIVGVITDRDICIACATRRRLPEQLTAGEVMHAQPIHTTRPDDPVEIGLMAMQQFRVRRLPVVASDGTLCGVVSMNDIIVASQEKNDPKAVDVVGALSGICAHTAEAVALV